MRVITGTARGKRLQSPEGLHTRPTADRVKEAMFNILMERLFDAKVLDVFAGSGALGIEALSRGAASCVFLENDASCVTIIKENLTATHLSENAKVVFGDALQFLKTTEGTFDIIFLDPPYDAGLYEAVLADIKERELLTENGVVLLERRAASPVEPPEGFCVILDRKYGKTAITMMKGRKENG